MIKIGIGIPTSFVPSSVSYDTNASAYFSAAGITNTSVKTAINNFVVSLKAQGLWTKLYAFYPIVGNLTQSSYNLVTPGSYQVTWADTPTITSNSIAFNGTTQYGNTNFSPIAVAGFSMNDVSFGCWDATGFNSRTEIPMGTTQDSGFQRIRAVWFNTNSNILDIMSNNDTTSRVVFLSQAVGHWHFQRLSNVTSVYFNGASYGTNSSAGDISIIPTNKIFIGATSDGVAGANTPALYSQKTYKFFYIAKGLTGPQITTFNTLLTTLNTALGR